MAIFALYNQLRKQYQFTYNLLSKVFSQITHVLTKQIICQLADVHKYTYMKSFMVFRIPNVHTRKRNKIFICKTLFLKFDEDDVNESCQYIISCDCKNF